MTEEQMQKKKINFKKIGFNVSVLFSTIGVFVLLGLFYFLYMQFGMLYDNLMLTADDLEKKVTTSSASSQTNTDQFQQLNAQLKRQLQTIAELRQTVGQRPDHWRFAEADYLVKLASDNLRFTQNVPAALALLQDAADQIKPLTSSAFQDMHKALASDIAHLQSMSPVNQAEVYTQLIKLNAALEQLPLITPQANNAAKLDNTTEEDVSQLSWWRKGLYYSWKTLQRIVIVQHNTSNQLPLIMPEQQRFLYQNLHSQIETAIWGLLHQQATMYQTSLAQLNDWIKLYFVQDSSLTQSVLASLAELQKIQVQMPTVSINDSLQAFQNYSQSQENHDQASVSTARS